MLASLRRNRLIRQVLDLRMPPGDYALAGSAPLYAHGLRARLRDVDVVARGPAWDLAQMFGKPVRAPSGIGRVVRIGDGEIEIFDRWVAPQWPIDSLIDGAEVIDGIRFVSLRDSLAWKRYLNRAKDVPDIRLLEAYFREQAEYEQVPAYSRPIATKSKV
ncbi:MAG TPA: hypothetical protein VGS97_15780 [Actinocrinis sp.]|uniref:hypothetical protein n=1 Tax=Actinocrinis sp. TaxID=1920516 RepID=UPI002DDD79F3|nr:hypothetical protein [Actinocrinis sp.]HEV2345558.1 hypothetical protein [Actinocrinis sp.]